SWCSERRRLDVLKLLLGRLETARPARGAIGCGRAAARLARRMLEGPRAATRSREADMISVLLWSEGAKRQNPEPREDVRRAIGGAGARQRWAGPGRACFWHRTIFRLTDASGSLSWLALVIHLSGSGPRQ
ncbi:d2575c96-a888-4e4a-b852-e1e0b7876fbf, partial [Thermothielavioides terrestris]